MTNFAVQTGDEPGTLQTQWKPTPFPHPNITGYQVQYYPISSTSTSTSTVSLMDMVGSTLEMPVSHILRNLQRNTDYRVSVMVVCEGGVGPSSVEKEGHTNATGNVEC